MQTASLKTRVSWIPRKYKHQEMQQTFIEDVSEADDKLSNGN